MKKDNSDELVKKLTEMIDIIKKDDEPVKVEQIPVEKIPQVVSKCPMSGCPLKKMLPDNKQCADCPLKEFLLKNDVDLKDCKKGVCVIRFDLDKDGLEEEEEFIDFNVDSDSTGDNQMDPHKTQQDWVSYTVKSCILSSIILMLFIMIFVNIFKIIRTSF